MTKLEFKDLLFNDQRLAVAERLALGKAFDQATFSSTDINTYLFDGSDAAISYLIYIPQLLPYLLGHLPFNLKPSDPAIVDKYCVNLKYNLLLRIFLVVRASNEFDAGQNDYELHGLPFKPNSVIMAESITDLMNFEWLTNETLVWLDNCSSITVQDLRFDYRFNHDFNDAFFKSVGSVGQEYCCFTVVTYADIVAILTAFVNHTKVKGSLTNVEAVEQEKKGNRKSYYR